MAVPSFISIKTVATVKYCKLIMPGVLNHYTHKTL